MQKRIEMFCDGIVSSILFSGQPRYYYVIYDADGKILFSGSGSVSDCKTNAIAKYHAVAAALSTALMLNFAEVPITLKINSREIVKHCKSQWPVKKKVLIHLHQRTMALVDRFKDIKFETYKKDRKDVEAIIGKQMEG